ncbi:MAG: NADH-quinone oxidoreductase subunit K [Hyphomicrobiaceae bacterium]
MISAPQTATLLGLCGAALVGIGLFVVIVHPRLLRKIVGFNLLGAGIFLVFGVAAMRGAAAGLASDPVPQALVITGIVVAFSATALAVALVRRLFELTGHAALDSSAPAIASRGEQ